MDITETLKTGKVYITFLHPACLSSEFSKSIILLQPQEKGESFGIEKMEQGFNTTLFFFRSGHVCASCVSKRQRGEAKKGKQAIRSEREHKFVFTKLNFYSSTRDSAPISGH